MTNVHFVQHIPLISVCGGIASDYVTPILIFLNKSTGIFLPLLHGINVNHWM